MNNLGVGIAVGMAMNDNSHISFIEVLVVVGICIIIFGIIWWLLIK